MNSRKLLRFKIVTSFAFAALGMLTFVRLAAIEPLSVATLLPFVMVSIFVIAAIWRGCIYLQAIRGLAKS